MKRKLPPKKVTDRCMKCPVLTECCTRGVENLARTLPVQLSKTRMQLEAVENCHRRKSTGSAVLLKKLTAAGMTLAEVDAFHHLAQSANRILALPVLHPMEREEVCHDIHVLQNRLLARPGLRSLGWPGKPKKGCETTSVRVRATALVRTRPVTGHRIYQPGIGGGYEEGKREKRERRGKRLR